MRKLALILAATVAMTTVVSAGEDRRQQHHRHQHNHQQYYNGNNNWVAPLVGGLIIGGMFGASSSQNYIAGPGYGNVPIYGYSYQPICQRVHVGSFWNGFRWVNQYQTYCQ